MEPAAGFGSGAKRGRNRQSHIQRKRRCWRAEEGIGKRRKIAEHSLCRRLRAPIERHHLLWLPSDARHRRLPFSRRRLDGGEAVERERGAGIAAFLRRPDPPPRHPRLIEFEEHSGLLTGILQPPAIARQQRTRRNRIRRWLGCALLSAARQRWQK